MTSLKLPTVTDPRALPAALSVVALLSPAGVLAFAALTQRATLPVALWAGAGATALLALVLQHFVAWQPLRTPFTGVPAAIASVALWIGGLDPGNSFGFFAHGALV